MLERMFVALLYHIRYNFAKLPNKLFRSNLRNDIMVNCVDQWRAPMRRPVIKTSLPGPVASKLIDVDKKYVSPSYTRTYPLVVDQGHGLWVRDVDGNEFLDFTAGIAVCSTGHCHPKVVESIKKQADRLLHMSGTDFYYKPQIALAEKLAALVSDDETHKVYFGNSGAEAV